MNILEDININTEKPAILNLKKEKGLHYFAVGLGKDQWLKKHKTSIPAFLTVLHGSIEFRMEGKSLTLKELDTLAIPVEVLHEVIGLQDANIFTILKNG